ncbi:MAG: hypothetical protein GXP63_03290 [DPANN group archaeon]|nr:hypothetical protein [DPANN group archaeon]
MLYQQQPETPLETRTPDDGPARYRQRTLFSDLRQVVSDMKRFKKWPLIIYTLNLASIFYSSPGTATDDNRQAALTAQLNPRQYQGVLQVSASDLEPPTRPTRLDSSSVGQQNIDQAIDTIIMPELSQERPVDHRSTER